jgi:hypothetical protein
VLPTAPSDADGVITPEQLSDAVAPPNAASIVAVDGLHPSAVEEVAVGVTVGTILSVALNVCVHVFVQPFKVVIRVKVYEPQVLPATTVTFD